MTVTERPRGRGPDFPGGIIEASGESGRRLLTANRSDRVDSAAADARLLSLEQPECTPQQPRIAKASAGSCFRHYLNLERCAGRALRMLGTMMDVTARKGVEIAQEQSEARFRAICDAAPIGILLIHPNGDVVYSNPSGLRLRRCWPRIPSQ